jgi:hypothetical protein
LHHPFGKGRKIVEALGLSPLGNKTPPIVLELWLFLGVPLEDEGVGLMVHTGWFGRIVIITILI